MKRVFTIALISALFGMTSCKKCATCTKAASDPRIAAGTILEEEFCESGRTYDTQLTVFEEQGWTCSED